MEILWLCGVIFLVLSTFTTFPHILANHDSSVVKWFSKDIMDKWEHELNTFGKVLFIPMAIVMILSSIPFLPIAFINYIWKLGQKQ